MSSGVNPVVYWPGCVQQTLFESQPASSFPFASVFPGSGARGRIANKLFGPTKRFGSKEIFKICRSERRRIFTIFPKNFSFRFALFQTGARKAGTQFLRNGGEPFLNGSSLDRNSDRGDIWKPILYSSNLAPIISEAHPFAVIPKGLRNAWMKDNLPLPCISHSA